MSTDLMSFDTSQIKVRPGDVEFYGFEKLKKEALQLSEQISQVEVTDENLKVSKKMLAAVNNRVKEIESKRISIKKELLEPYSIFESQVKEIVGIVKDADSTVRQQVKDLEERERDEKREKLLEIFQKRISHYQMFHDFYSPDDFIKSQHLNKSTSLKSVETEMVEWLEKKDSDFKVILSLPNGNEVLSEYLDTNDLSVAINIVNDREERKKQLEKVTPVKKSVEDMGQVFIITLSDEKDHKLVEMFMQQNKINYKTEKVAK